MDNNQKIKTLIIQLNNLADSYYNHNISLVPDEVYDKMYDGLLALEQETGIILSNSPTQKVQGEILPSLAKITHTTPMLSAQKTTDIKQINQFIKTNVVASYKYDGITVCVRYSDGKMIKAITRGNGYTGEDITHTARFITNLPLTIPFNGNLEVRGEAVISWDNYNKINVDGTMGHPRSAVSGLLRSLDSSKVKDKHIELFVFSLTNWEDFPEIKTTKTSFDWLASLGFTVVEHELIVSDELAQSFVNSHDRTTYAYPTDGYIFTLNSLMDYKEAGNTAHHPRGMIALKPAFEAYDTTLRSIDWQVGRTGVLTPVANFDTVEINESEIGKASIHNLSVIDSVLGKPYIGQKIKIGLANLIIPMVYEGEKKDEGVKFIEIPTVCPICGGKTEIVETTNSKSLRCTNEHCPAKMLAKFTHFVSKECMNIDGLSEASLEDFINAGLLKTYSDIYRLKEYKDKILKLEGWGEKSFQNLVDAIEQSRHTTLARFINSLGIPNIGRSASKTIDKTFNGDIDDFLRMAVHYDFQKLEDFGPAMERSIREWYDGEHDLDGDVMNYLIFEKDEPKIIEENFCLGKTFCVTGKFETMKRGEIEDLIVTRGGKLSSSVSKKTDFLLTNDTESGSSKNTKAKELGISILSEVEFIEKVGK